MPTVGVAFWVLSLAVLISCGLVTPAGAAPGTLTVEAIPAEVSADSGVVVVRVSNSGAEPVTGITVRTESSSGITAQPAETSVEPLAPGASRLVGLTVTGTSGVVVVEASGMSGDTPVSGATAIKVSAAHPQTLTLVGNTRLTEHSPADLKVVVANPSPVAVTMTLSADAGDHDAELERHRLKLEPGETENVALEVHSDGALRSGKVGVIVTAKVKGDPASSVVATRELDVSHTSDEIATPLGVTAVIAIPGLVALLAFFEVRARDRRRIHVAHPGAKAVWDNKTWLLLAGALSLLAVWLFARVGGRDLLDAFEIVDIVVLTIALGGIGALVALVANWYHRTRVAVITEDSSPTEVLKAAQRSSHDLARRRFKTADGKFGLLVHRDGNALVLSPPIAFGSGGPVLTAFQDESDPDRFDKAVAALTSEFDGHFAPGTDEIAAPVALESAVEVGFGDLLRYVDE